ncbi:uncharacterized protein LOC111615743 [Centruroides sculpturatus]|uniref:uncharacterized protein LOC111615743 n=1 Tax=Centruroides sculpturatus TaxID=218467 RepID=UPI000C6E60CD|nr:uncharacterized protein LOC111615743 [Centruroides sculpturatus]
MSGPCFVCDRPVSDRESGGRWPEGSAGGGDFYHRRCLACAVCGLRPAGEAARRLGKEVYCRAHYVDVTGRTTGAELAEKLREFKRQSLGCAEARRKSSSSLHFPLPVHACAGSPHCPLYPHGIRPAPGYWVECCRDDSSRPEEGPVGPFRLTSYQEETYAKYFYGTEHWNYYTNDESLGPVVLSLKQEVVDSRDHFRILMRTVSYNLHGLVPASGLCADRYDREEVVRAIGRQAGLKPLPKLGRLQSTPDELVKLDQAFVKSELKVGVVYVKEGQVTEEQILGNRRHGPLFDEFLHLLGDRVRLKGFDRYKGGLDTVHDLTGTESVYTHWRNIEIMFHVSTLLPHEDHDPQKLQKKRHVGNDIVCVVFLEARDTRFSPACIKSHFLHTFVVVRTDPEDRSDPTTYQVSVVSRDEVKSYKPYLWHRSTFSTGPVFREWLLTKIVNGERASYSAPKFVRMQDRTKTQILEEIVANLHNHAETGQLPKPYRRGSWRPIGHTRPSSPLLDSVRDTFESPEQLAKDFAKSFCSDSVFCDVAFNVGPGKRKTKIYAVRAILGVRSRVFLEMLYGFSTGFGQNTLTIDKITLNVPGKSSNFLQVPEMNEAPRTKSAPSSPMMIRAFSRLGNWKNWGLGSRSSSKDQLLSEPEGLKRWQSECNCKEKTDKNEATSPVVSLSVCADAQKIDKTKLSKTEFNIIEFDSDTFRTLIEYLHSGSCPLTCDAIPGLICAAEHYDLPELLQACFHHVKQHLRISVVCSMLNALENYYWRYTAATELMTMILQHVDQKASQLFCRKDFLSLSESMLQTIISRKLNIAEVKKFEIMYEWAQNKVKNMRCPDKQELQFTMNRLIRDLKLNEISPEDLVQYVLPTKVISKEKILETLMQQEDSGIYSIHPSYIEKCQNQNCVQPDLVLSAKNFQDKSQQ